MTFHNIGADLFAVRIRSGGGYYHIYAGQNSFDGATLQLFGRTNSSYAGYFYLRASDKSSSTSSGSEAVLRGSPDGTLLWNGSPVQVSSDRRLKTKPAPVDDAVLDSWGGVLWGEYKMLASIAEKGDFCWIP